MRRQSCQDVGSVGFGTQARVDTVLIPGVCPRICRNPAWRGRRRAQDAKCVRLYIRMVYTIVSPRYRTWTICRPRRWGAPCSGPGQSPAEDLLHQVLYTLVQCCKLSIPARAGPGQDPADDQLHQLPDLRAQGGGAQPGGGAALGGQQLDAGAQPLGAAAQGGPLPHQRRGGAQAPAPGGAPPARGSGPCILYPLEPRPSHTSTLNPQPSEARQGLIAIQPKVLHSFSVRQGRGCAGCRQGLWACGCAPLLWWSLPVGAAAPDVGCS